MRLQLSPARRNAAAADHSAFARQPHSESVARPVRTSAGLRQCPLLPRVRCPDNTSRFRLRDPAELLAEVQQWPDLARLHSEARRQGAAEPAHIFDLA